MLRIVIMYAMLVRKFLLTANLSGLTEEDFMKNVKGKVKAQADNPTIVAGLTPPVDEVNHKVADLDTLFAKRTSLLSQLRQNTKDIKNGMTEVNDIIIEQWMPQTLVAISGNEGLAKLLGFGTKGTKAAPSDPVSTNNSHLVIINIDVSVHLQHTIEVVNNITKNSKKPFDADHIDIYMLVGGDAAPVDIKKMQYLGVATRGKIKNKFLPEQLGQSVWYIAVYVNKKTMQACTLSSAQKAPIL